MNELEAVKDVINKAVDAMYNDEDKVLVKKYYHSGYILFLIGENDELEKVPLNKRWIFTNQEQADDKDSSDDEEHVVTTDIKDVVISGNAATVYFQYFINGRHTCEDFMSLYKFKDGWKIVSQTTHHIQD